MMRILFWAGLAMSILSGSDPGDEMPGITGQPQPVLVELFTSEGCSSCPPADALLERLDRTQPVPGAQIIVLSEHVDYWNRIGWTDPYSSPAFSARQELYARRFRTREPFTPQMVVDGSVELVGSDARSAESAIRSALRQPKVSVRIVAPEPDAISVTLEVDPLPAGRARKANVYLAYAADAGTSNVLGGENKGQRLHHVSIVKALKEVGTVDDRSRFATKVRLKSGSRLIVFVQEPGNGTVLGAAMRPASR